MRAIVFSIDDNYVMPFKVFFYSLVKTGSLVDGDPIFVLHEETLSKVSMACLELFFSENGQKANFVDVTRYLPDDLPILEGNHVSKATFYRLFVAELLPEEVSSILYLDSDVLAVKSIRDLLTIELTAPLAAVDHLSLNNQLRLWGEGGGSYFQAGVLLIDLVFWRRNKCVDAFDDIMKNERDLIQWWDQDVLNIAFANNWQRLSVWNNVVNQTTIQFSEFELLENAKLIHFDGRNKPWLGDVQRPFKDLWLTAYMDTFGKELENQGPFPDTTLWQKFGRTIKKRVKQLISGECDDH